MGVFQNISIVRKRDEVLSTKQFAWTMGLVSLVAGIIVGVACVYIEMSNKYGADVEHSLENRWAFGAMAVLVLYCVYLILPFMKSAGKTVGEKILTAVVGCGLIGGGYRDNYGHHYEKVDGKIIQKD